MSNRFAHNDLQLNAFASYMGTSLVGRADIVETPIRAEVEAVVASNGRKQKIVSTLAVDITIPIFNKPADLLPIFAQLQTFNFGRNIGPVPLLTTFNTTTDVVTSAAHNLNTGEKVWVGADETLPTLGSGALDPATAVYFRKTDANTGTLYDTQGHANAGGGTGKLDFSAVGTGDFYLFREFPLTLFRRTGVQRVYGNVVCVEYPKLMFNGGAWFFDGNLRFRAMPAVGTAPSGVAATDLACIYTDSAQAYSSPARSGSDQLTQPAVSAVWGVSSPWSSFRSMQGLACTIAPKFTDFHDGVWPIAAQTFDDCTCSVEGAPIGITKPEYDLAQAAALGALLDGADLVITSAAVVLTLKQAILRAAATNYSANKRFISKLTWDAEGSGAADFKAPFTLVGA